MVTIIHCKLQWELAELNNIQCISWIALEPLRELDYLVAGCTQLSRMSSRVLQKPD